MSLDDSASDASSWSPGLFGGLGFGDTSFGYLVCWLVHGRVYLECYLYTPV